jgi:hypothetical protein
MYRVRLPDRRLVRLPDRHRRRVGLPDRDRRRNIARDRRPLLGDRARESNQQSDKTNQGLVRPAKS